MKNKMGQKRQNKWLKVAGMALFLLSMASAAMAATLTLEGKAVPTEQTSFDLLVSFSQTNEAIAAFDFTLTYDASKLSFNKATVDLNLQAAGKDIVINQVSAGTLRGIVFGVNNGVLNSGNLFKVSFNKAAGAAEGKVTITLGNINAANGQAQSQTLTAVNNAVTLNEVVFEPAPEAPVISNTKAVLNQNNFSLAWSDESASGATEYIITKAASGSAISPESYSSGLISYWPMDDANTAAKDQKSLHSLTALNSPKNASDKPLGVVRGSKGFDSATHDALVLNPAPASLEIGSRMGWSGWVKPTTLSEEGTIFQKWAATGAAGKYYSLSVTSQGELKGIVSSDGKNLQVAKSKIGVVRPGLWQHFAMNVDVQASQNPFSDAMGTHTIAATGKAKLNTNMTKFGSAALGLSGSGIGNLTIPAHNDFVFGASDFTIDFWTRFEDASGHLLFLGQAKDGRNRWSIARFAGGALQFFYMDQGIVKADITTAAAWNPPLNQWVHIAFVRKGTQLKMYMNGVEQTLEVSIPIGSNSLDKIDAPLTIGGDASGFFQINGYMDELRIVNGSAAWAGNFQVPQGQYSGNEEDNKTKLLMHFGSSENIALYLNGKNVTSSVAGAVNQDAAPSASIFAVGSDVGGKKSLNGLVADLAVWNRVLTDTEIQTLGFGSRTQTKVNGTSSEQNNLTDGVYYYWLQSAKASGTVSEFSLPYKVTIDTTPPASPVFESPAAVVSQKTIEIKGTADADSVAVQLVTTPGLVISQQPTLSNLSWTAQATVSGDGNYTISAAAKDASGNLSEVVQKTFTVDTLAPQVTFAKPTKTTYTVSLKSVLFQGTVDDENVKSAIFRYVLSDGDTADVTVPIQSGAFSFNHQLRRGVNQCFFIIKDNAGNQATKEFNITYANNLPLVFDNLTNYSVNTNQDLRFTVSITNQQSIEPELLTFSVSDLPGSGTSNVAKFDLKTRVFTWKPNESQLGLHSVTFDVTDGTQMITKTVKIVVRNYLFNESNLNDILALPKEKNVVVFDFNKDGYDDIFEVVHGRNKLFKNMKDGTFTDVATTAGVDDPQEAGNAVLAEDFNADGWKDLYIVNEGKDKLYINNKNGTFTNKTDSYQLGDTGAGREAVLMDFDNDGDKDLYVLNDGANSFYENLGNNTFKDVSVTIELNDAGDAINVVVEDFDGNGFKDIYLINEGKNKFFLNQGSLVFQEANSNLNATDDYDGFRGLARDIDQDGDADILLVNHARDIVYQNDGRGIFKEIILTKTTNTVIADKFALLIDYDNDKDLDVFVIDSNSKYVDGIGNVLFHNDGNGSFTDYTAAANLI